VHFRTYLGRHNAVVEEVGVQQGELVVVLVVEDDSLIQDVVGDALSEGGFKVEIVGTGEQAVEHLQRSKDTYRALVTDINLSGQLNGWDVAKLAREINPEIPVIYMTDAAADQWPSHGVPGSIILNKPFAPVQVVTAVAQLLNQGQPLQHQ